MGKGSSKHAGEAGDNSDAFDPLLLDELPEDFRQKLKDVYSSFKSQYEELESQYDRYRVDSGEHENRAMTATL